MFPFFENNLSVPARRERFLREIFLSFSKNLRDLWFINPLQAFRFFSQVTPNIHFFVQDSDDFYSIRFKYFIHN
jgi:hypothetical protein